jgi:hypothetical protein
VENGHTLSPLARAIIYKFGRKVGWSKTGQVPAPLFRRMVEACLRKRTDLVLEDLSDIIITVKRQHEYVARFTEKGFQIALRIRDEYEDQI